MCIRDRLHPAQPLDVLRTLISAWVSACAEPREGDVARLEEVLLACVARGALYKAAGTVRWWKEALAARAASPPWAAAVARVERAIERAVDSSVDM